MGKADITLVLGILVICQNPPPPNPRPPPNPPWGLPKNLMVVFMLMCRRLAKQGISLVFPEVLKQGASADTVCFDKTGTLTGSLVSYCSASGGFCSLSQTALAGPSQELRSK